MATIGTSALSFIDKVVEFSGSASYELLQPLTDFRVCHDGIPAESGILFTCKPFNQSQQDPDIEEIYVVKVKVQIPEDSPTFNRAYEAGPSTTTSAELKALELFQKAKNSNVPQLMSWKKAIQREDGPLPGGYVTYMVMTKMPGETLFNLQYWGMDAEEREEVVRQFLPALRSIYALGVEPIDCALRNVLWDRQSKKCSIIDFELWRETTDTFPDEIKELQRWGLARSPPPDGWFSAWKMQQR